MDCGKQIALRSQRCPSCASKNSVIRKVAIQDLPTREKLKWLIRNKTFVEIGKSFSVSDNAIRKWCKNYNLPTKKAEIKKYTDKEWETI